MVAIPRPSRSRFIFNDMSEHEINVIDYRWTSYKMINSERFLYHSPVFSHKYSSSTSFSWISWWSAIKMKNTHHLNDNQKNASHYQLLHEKVSMCGRLIETIFTWKDNPTTKTNMNICRYSLPVTRPCGKNWAHLKLFTFFEKGRSPSLWFWRLLIKWTYLYRKIKWTYIWGSGIIFRNSTLERITGEAGHSVLR
jgi:hypothetical protein